MSVWRSELDEHFWRKIRRRSSLRHARWILRRAVLNLSILALFFVLGIEAARAELTPLSGYIGDKSAEIGQWVRELGGWFQVLIGSMLMIGAAWLAAVLPILKPDTRATGVILNLLIFVMFFELGLEATRAELTPLPPSIENKSAEIAQWAKEQEGWLQGLIGASALAAAAFFSGVLNLLSRDTVAIMARRLPRPSLRAVGISIMSLYLLLAALHITNGFNLDEALGAGLQDLRAFATCPHRPNDVWAFINRSPLHQWGIDIGHRFSGETVYPYVCDGTFRGLVE